MSPSADENSAGTHPEPVRSDPGRPGPVKPVLVRPLRLDGPVLPGAGSEEPRSWGEAPGEPAADYLAERPPHHER